MNKIGNNLKICSWVLLHVVIIWVSSCKEELNLINYQATTELVVDSAAFPSPQVVQEKCVLIEDFTGVKCVNCPTAAETIEEIANANTGRVFAVGLHVTPELGSPYPESKYDFRIQAGENLYNLFDRSPGLPAGAIDRIKYQGRDRILVGYNLFSSLVTQRLTLPLQVAITRDSITYDVDRRNLSVSFSTHFRNNIDSAYVTVMITESNIVDHQETPDGIDPNYVHNHVLRLVSDPYGGTLLKGKNINGQSRSLHFSTNIPEAWNVNESHLLILVHTLRGNRHEVLQTQEYDLVR